MIFDHDRCSVGLVKLPYSQIYDPPLAINPGQHATGTNFGQLSI
jgi:hypothetical protein